MSLEIKILGLILICGLSVRAQLQNVDELRRRHRILLAEVQQLNATYNRIFDEQFEASVKIEELEKQLNATPDTNPALTAEIRRLEIELFNCTEITKYCKSSIQSSLANIGGGIKGLILSALNSIQSIKKKVADILHKKINSLRINITNMSSTNSSLSQSQTAPNSSAVTPMPTTTTSTTQRPNARNSRSGGLFGRLFSWFM